MVVYEVNLRAFSASGNLDGVRQRLDHIQSLGVNVLWLMPIYPIGIENGVNSPYAISDYKEVNPEFGTLNDLIKLVNEAHRRDMAVIMDWVGNHTAWDHLWMEHKDWYSQDAEGNIIAPPGTGWTDVAELNFANQDMRDEMISDMTYWIHHAGIDGYRCDAVDFVPEDFWSEAIVAVDASTTKSLIWLAEGGIVENFQAGFAFNYGWDFYGKIKGIYSEDQSASGIFVTNEQEFNVVPDGKTKLRYITNHDLYAWDETPTEVYGEQGSVGAFVSTAFMAGVPLIYSGQEVANSELISFFGKNPINWSQNPEILSQYQSVMAARASVVDILTGDLAIYGQKDVIVFKHTKGTEEVLVVVNTRDKEVVLPVPAELQGTTWTNLLTESSRDIGSELVLSTKEYLILKTR
ncbi:hypothetical protein BFP72_00415 [Reichenbachiella sp. 5M10]|nr:hypothetical protein BFP72_00415 [Reichenbachiella sp. 5M10]